MDEITSVIGSNLKKLRKDRHLTLEMLSQLTGVSTSMLGEIERGATNPTIGIVWKIADGLKISLSELIREEQPSVTLVRRQDAGTYKTGEGFDIFSLHNFDPEKKLEILYKVLQPGASFISEGHRKGIEEYLLIVEGTLQLQIGEQSFTLQQGDSIRFTGDIRHVYHNPGKVPLQAFTLMYYGE